MKSRDFSKDHRNLGVWAVVVFAGVAILGLIGGDAYGCNDCREGVVDWVPTTKCKYSVRDVAFVNVHGKSWQLELVKPDRVADDQFENWNKTLKTRLANTNLGFVWHSADSDRGGQLNSQLGKNESTRNQLPKMFLTNSKGRVLPVLPQNQGMEASLEGVVTSPTRQEILSYLPESLCVFLLICGDDDKANQRARETLDLAAEQVKKTDVDDGESIRKKVRPLFRYR